MTVLTKPQAVACVYAMDTHPFCAHLTIGPDIDVQKLNSGCVIVQGKDGSEHYPNVQEFIAAYEIPIEVHPLREVEADLQHHSRAAALGRKAPWIVLALVALLGVVLWRL